MKAVDPKLTVAIIVLVAALVMLGASASRTPVGDDDQSFGLIAPDKQPAAPDFTLQAADGRTVKLSDAVKQGPVVLDFWATWCGPCKMELPDLQSVYSAYKGRGVQFYGIDSDPDVSPAEISSFAEQNHVDFPMLLDSKAQAAQAYSVDAIPRTIIVDKDMKVVANNEGYDPQTKANLSHSLDSLL